jgi:hypothetical protein
MWWIWMVCEIVLFIILFIILFIYIQEFLKQIPLRKLQKWQKKRHGRKKNVGKRRKVFILLLLIHLNINLMIEKARKAAAAAAAAQNVNMDQSQQPVFHLNRCYLKMAPTLEEVNKVLDATVSEGMIFIYLFFFAIYFFSWTATSLLASIDRPLSLTSHRPFLPEVPPEGVNLNQILGNDKQFGDYCSEMKRIVETSFQIAEKFLERFYPLGRIFEYSLKWDIEKYKKKHGIDSIAQIR